MSRKLKLIKKRIIKLHTELDDIKNCSRKRRIKINIELDKLCNELKNTIN